MAEVKDQKEKQDGQESDAVAAKMQPVPVPVCEKCGAIPSFNDWVKHGAAFVCSSCGHKIKFRGAGYSEVYLDAANRQRVVDAGQTPPEQAEASVEKRKTTVDPETGAARHRLGFWVAAEHYPEIHLAIRVALFNCGIVDEKKQKKALGIGLHAIAVDFLSGVAYGELPPELAKLVEEFQNRPATDDEVIVLKKQLGADAGEEGEGEEGGEPLVDGDFEKEDGDGEEGGGQ